MSTFTFGVDEAGRGPAIGSLFAAAVAADPDVLPDGLADSKTLSPARRTELADRLRDTPDVRIGLAEITSDRIDDPDTDMNGLTVAAHVRAIDTVVDDGERGIVDACDVDEERFSDRVGRRLEREVAVVAEHGADERYELVAAASVIAKVERDAHVERLAAEYGPLGSGYPSDPTTRSFLTSYVDEHGTLPDCARRSWRTCRAALADASQQSLDSF